MIGPAWLKINLIIIGMTSMLIASLFREIPFDFESKSLTIN